MNKYAIIKYVYSTLICCARDSMVEWKKVEKGVRKFGFHVQALQLTNKGILRIWNHSIVGLIRALETISYGPFKV